MQEFNKGGLADSLFAGVGNSLYKLTGLNPHEKPDILTVHQKMTKETDVDAPNELVMMINTSVGNILAFSRESGKIWEKTSAGDWRLVHTIAGTGADIVLGAREYDGYIYMACAEVIHRITVANCDNNNWSADIVSNWATFTVKDPLYHPMWEVNKVLYIGDGYLVAQVDAGTFSANAFDISSQFRVTSLGEYDTDLLVGTYVSDNITETYVYRWNTYSDSFSVSDPVPETGIWSFVPIDNFVLVQAGTQGNIYYYDGRQLKQYMKIQGTYSKTAKAKVKFESTANLHGKAIFGLSNITGNPADCGVYMLGRYADNYPLIMHLAFPISQRSGTDFVLTNIEFGSVLVSGEDVYVSWKDTNGSAVAGVDKLDYSNKLDGAYLETRVLRPRRLEDLTLGDFSIAYYSLPANTDIQLYYKINYSSGSWVEVDLNNDTNKKVLSNSVGVTGVAFQFKAKVTTSSNNAPEFEEISTLVR